MASVAQSKRGGRTRPAAELPFQKPTTLAVHGGLNANSFISFSPFALRSEVAYKRGGRRGERKRRDLLRQQAMT